MKKNSKQNKRGVELLELDKRLHVLFCVKQHLFMDRQRLQAMLTEETVGLSQQRLMGEATDKSEIRQTELHMHMVEMDGRERRLNTETLDLEKKTAFFEGEASGRTEAAKAGASARGNKYSTMKTAALEWYSNERHKFHNKDDAAIEITKTHAVEFSTARGWLKGV